MRAILEPFRRPAPGPAERVAERAGQRVGPKGRPRTGGRASLRRGAAGFHDDGFDFAGAIAAERRGLVIFFGFEAGDALFQRRKFNHHEAVERVGTLHDLEAPAAGQHLAAMFGDDGGDAVGVFLVFDGIDDAGTRNPIGGHGTSWTCHGLTGDDGRS